MKYQIRPLNQWGRPKTEPRAGSGRFRATWQSTLDLLGREVEFLGGDLVAIQVDVTEGELRRDGMLRSRAQVGFPGVKVSFDSRHGPLAYATDAYDSRYYSDPPGWQANIRAIALALEALRAVDRYGVTSSGEQYRGWTAIAPVSAEFDMTPAQAADLLAAVEGTPWTAAAIIRDQEAALSAYRWAARRYHPDVGGDVELFRRLTAARKVLEASRA